MLTRMPQSMRASASLNRRRDSRDLEERDKRKDALDLLEQGDLNLRQISEATGVGRRTLGRMLKAKTTGDEDSLRKLLDPENNRAGRKTVLTVDEEQMICERIKFAAIRGFGIYGDELVRVMRAIADDGRDSFHASFPSAETVRLFRSRHRDITLRSGQNKAVSKPLAENPDHAETLQIVLERVQTDYPHIMNSPEFVWNMDETSIATKGSSKKIFMSSRSKFPESRGSTSKGIGKHVTCMVTTSPSGRKIPPFLIIEGAKVMSRWFGPLPGPIPDLQDMPELNKYYSNGWCPDDIGISVKVDP